MLTVEEIVALAVRAAEGGRSFVFRDLARAVGIEARPGGWVYLPGGRRPVAHGWQAFARLLAGRRDWPGHAGRDLLVEMSKRSASPADVAAAEVEAHDDAAAYAQNAAHVVGRPSDGARQVTAWRGRIRDAVVGYPSATALRSAKRRLVATAYDEALAEGAHREALAIAGSIPIDGRPAEVTLMLEAAELLNDEHENLAALRAARARYDELTAAPADIVVTFERVGRSYGVVVTLDGKLANDPDELRRLLRQQVRKHIASKEFELWIDYDLGDVLIDGGRFGRGKIEGLPQVPCDCDGTHAPVEGGHSVACRKRETLYMIDRPTLDEQHEAALAMNANPLKREPAPRAERLDAAFKAFVELADSGGPGTSRGLIAAVEGATTVTEAQLVRAFARANRSVPGDDAVGAVRYLLRELGFAVVAG